MAKKGAYFIAMWGLLVGLGFGCAGPKVDENDPASVYEDAEREIQDEHYQIALDKLRMVKNKFPYSQFSAKAQLRMGDVYFLQDSFLEAAAAYETFRDLYPKHDQVGYASFRMGESYLNDVPSITARDLTSANKGLEAFTLFIEKYPSDPKLSEAISHQKKLRDILAEKESYIGDFYFRKEQYDSAQVRYKKVIEKYPESEFASHARKRLAAIPVPKEQRENQPESNQEKP